MIASIGGPELSIQLGRSDSPTLAYDIEAVKRGEKPKTKAAAFPVIDWKAENGAQVLEASRRAGVTERELTTVLGCLLLLEKMPKIGDANYANSGRAGARQRGKMGRSFQSLDEEDFEEDENGDIQDMYIADAFGTAKQAYGKGVQGVEFNDLFKKNFKPLGDDKYKGEFWIERLLQTSPATSAWVSSYSITPVRFTKDLQTAYYGITSLGGVYTGGKYASLLEGKDRNKLDNDK